MSLLAWYPLTSNGNTQGLDNTNLTTMGSITYSAGKLGNSATFAGNAANCLHRAYFSILNNFTWSFWFKNTTITTGSQFIVSQGRDYEKYGFNVIIANGTLKVLYGTGSTINIGTCAVNTWYHVAVTVDSSGVKAYLNGELKATGTYVAPDYTYANERFVIGKMSYSYTSTTTYFPFYGQVCDVRVYDNVISLKEIKEIAKGLMLHYKLSGDTGTNLSTLTNSKIIPSINVLNDYKATKTNHEDHVSIECTTAGTGFYFAPFSKSDDKVGKTYTWSFYGKCNVTKTGNVGHEAGGQKSITLTTEWQLFTHTWTFSTSTYSAFTFYMNWNVGEILYIKDFKFEEGSKATPWCPSSAESLYTEMGMNSTEETDLSGNKNNGTKGTITKISSDGARYGSSYNFTNLDKVSCPSIPFESMEKGTLSFWIKFNSFNNWSHYAFFANAFNWTGQTSDFIIVAIQSQLSSAATTTNICLDCCSYTKGVSMTTGQWYHIAFTWDVSTYTIKKYVNGSCVETLNDSTNKRLDTYRAKHSVCGLGNATGGTNYAGDFNMNDFRIYATALSDTDILAMYNSPISSSKNGTLLAYEFEEV